MKLAIYIKNDDGTLTYRGDRDEGFPSKQAAWEHYDRLSGYDPAPTPVIDDLLGWPHDKIEWWGDRVGFGITA